MSSVQTHPPTLQDKKNLHPERKDSVTSLSRSPTWEVASSRRGPTEAARCSSHPPCTRSCAQSRHSLSVALSLSVSLPVFPTAPYCGALECLTQCLHLARFAFSLPLSLSFLSPGLWCRELPLSLSPCLLARRLGVWGCHVPSPCAVALRQGLELSGGEKRGNRSAT